MKYSEITIGYKEKISHTITKEDVSKFVELTGDDNKLHIDEKFANTTQFKKPVVHGMLGASFISTLIGTKLPGDGALWFSQTLEFLLPVRVGDNLTIVAEVIKKIEKENIIELKTEIINQNRQVVTQGYAKVKVIEQIVESTNHEYIAPKRRVGLVIGATGGIGRATCLALANDGFNIIIHYNRNKTQALEIKNEVEEKGINAIVLQANILDEGQIKDMIDKSVRCFGFIDTLVNCAAVSIPSIKFQELVWSDFLTQIELNIKSVILLTQQLVPQMIENKFGKIIMVGSYAFDKPNKDWAHYISAKGALIGLTRSLAIELAPKGIRVNMVTPSLVNTELTSDIPQKIKLLTAAQTPLRRLAETSDVASAISFLASNKADFLSGENIRVNGGQVMI